jgi:hypothetical protein
VAEAFPNIALASFRSEPSRCNADGNVRALLARLPVAVDDVRVVGAGHCAPENPTDGLCSLVCGSDQERHRELYQRLLYLFMRDALDAPRFATDDESLATALTRLEQRGEIAR